MREKIKKARININPVAGLQQHISDCNHPLTIVPESTSTQSRDYNFERWMLKQNTIIARININPVAGLQQPLPAPIADDRCRARININPVAGLQQTPHQLNPSGGTPESTSTQSRDYNTNLIEARTPDQEPESTSTQSRDYNNNRNRVTAAVNAEPESTSTQSRDYNFR